jgi:hypothetical protein
VPVAAALLATLLAASARPALAIEDVAIVDVARGRTLPHRTVVVEDGRITAVARAGRAAVPTGAVRIDGRGRTLVPGLVDLHVHLFNNSSGRPPNDWALPLFVAHGVTGVREMNARPENAPVLARWRAGLEAGTLVAPRVLSVAMPVRGPVDAVDANLAAATGATAIKVFSPVPADQFAATLEAARARGLPVVGHTPATVPLLEGARRGLATNEHLMQAYEACSTREVAVIAERAASADVEATVATQEPAVLAAFDARRCRAVARALARTGEPQVPTLILDAAPRDGRYAAHPLWPALREDEQARWRRNLDPMTDADRALERRRGEVSRRIVRIFRDAGVPLLAGTDAPMPEDYPGLSLHEELAQLVAAGLTPAEALRAATLGNARALGLDGELGSIAAGRRADLVLLDADPLRDIANTRRIHAVVLDGRLLRRADLDALLAPR